MISALQNLIDFWRSCPTQNAPFVAPQDKPFIVDKKTSFFTSFDGYIKDNILGNDQDKTLHVGLLPHPYAGDLRNASIFILMLNPSLSPTDYYGEYQNKKFRQMQIQNLQQDFKTDFPFHFLNPEFSWNAGFEYWHTKLGDAARYISKKKQIDYRKALELLSQKIARLELIPYRSKSFGAHSLINKLPSTQVMQAYVRDVLLPEAKNGNITIIVTRSTKNWGLTKRKNVIIYEGSETRSAHLTLATDGGRAIIKQLGL